MYWNIRDGVGSEGQRLGWLLECFSALSLNSLFLADSRSALDCRPKRSYRQHLTTRQGSQLLADVDQTWSHEKPHQCLHSRVHLKVWIQGYQCPDATPRSTPDLGGTFTSSWQNYLSVLPCLPQAFVILCAVKGKGNIAHIHFWPWEGASDLV
jgi:hypothetical protein